MGIAEKQLAPLLGVLILTLAQPISLREGLVYELHCENLPDVAAINYMLASQIVPSVTGDITSGWSKPSL
jgi:hypothetical protein